MNRSGNRMATDQSDRVLGLPRWTANGRGTVERILSAPAALATGLPRREEEHRHQVGLADPSPDAPDEGALARLGSMVLEAHGRIAEENRAHERVVAGIMAETSEEVARLLGAARAGVVSVRHRAPPTATVPSAAAAAPSVPVAWPPPAAIPDATIADAAGRPNHATATAPRAPLPPEAARPGLRRFLYVDTVLPMLAVLIVLVILLAWVG